ncbi:MAG: efflux RND transporter periplasmic adaptor subunit [Bryobacteraceae bacterium]
MRFWIVVLSVVVAACSRKNEGSGIRFSGNIEMTEVNVGFKVGGRLSEVLVSEGEVVKKGQVIARLDREAIDRQREREVAGMASAESQLAQAATALEWSRESQASELELRQAELAAAEARQRELEAGARPQEIREVEAATAAARSESERAAKDWERAEELFKRDDISASQHDQYRSRWRSAMAGLKQSEERLGLVKEGARREVIESARAQVARARAAVRRAEADRLEVARREQEVATRRAEIARVRAQIALLDSQIGDTVATTPVSGVVMVKSAETGEVIAAAMPVATVGDLAHPWLRGYISERDLGRVKIGSAVKVMTDSYPGKVYQGRVSFISSEAEFTPKQIQTPEERVKLVYRIKVEVENPGGELKSNMPADGEIELR